MYVCMWANLRTITCGFFMNTYRILVTTKSLNFIKKTKLVISETKRSCLMYAKGILIQFQYILNSTAKGEVSFL